MARYSAFLGLQVEVQYRAGDILLPASGTFVGDTGRSIFLEQSFEQRGQHRQFRWEIPYQYVVRLSEKGNSTAQRNSATAPTAEIEEKAIATELPQDRESHQAQIADEEEKREPENAAAAVAGCGTSVSVIFPRPRRSDS